MSLDWPTVESWLMGEAWVGSQIPRHLTMLCDTIGPRWASSSAEQETVAYINAQMREAGLAHVAAEEYTLHTWQYNHHYAAIVDDGEGEPVPFLPYNRCPSCDVQGPLVDVGFGAAYELEQAEAKLAGAVAVMNLGLAPFEPPLLMHDRLKRLAAAGAVAAVVVDRKDGGRLEYHSAGDWRDPGPDEHPLPTVTVTREVGTRLRKAAKAGRQLRVTVEAEFYPALAHNTSAELTGCNWPAATIILGGHHDTVYGTPGGNDNGSGTSVVLETARVLAALQQAHGVEPGCTLRFVTFSAEEQTLQGASAYVEQHYGADSDEAPPRLVINLDELATGTIKGLVLGFPHLRPLIQQQFDAMGDGLQCHIMAQLDSSSDHFPFLRAGIDAGHLWRWRFSGRRADSDFHHEPGDTTDKVDVRQLKEYVGQLARLLLRLSYVAPEAWPANPVTTEQVAQRLEAERGQLLRVF